jgi:hypothetical protein
MKVIWPLSIVFDCFHPIQEDYWTIVNYKNLLYHSPLFFYEKSYIALPRDWLWHFSLPADPDSQGAW